MPVERIPGNARLVDILDRVLDQGIRFDTGARAVLALPTPTVRITVESVETHLEPPTASPGRAGTGA